MMTRKTRELHDAVLDKIMSVYEEHQPDVYLNLERLISDFEKTIQHSCKQAFMGCECVGCWFHYGQLNKKKFN